MGSLPTLNPPQPVDVGRLVQLKQLLQAGPLEIQQRQQALQSGQLGIEQQQYEVEQRKAINDAYRNAVKPDENGQPQFDIEGLTKTLAASGHGEAIPSIMKGITDYQKLHNDVIEGQQKIDLATRDSGGAAGYAMLKANNDPNLADAIIEHAMRTPGIDQSHMQTYQAMRQQIQQDPTSVAKIAQQLIANSPKYSELQTNEMTAQARKLGAETGSKRLTAELPGGELADPKKAARDEFMKNPPKGYSSSNMSFEQWWAKQQPQAVLQVQGGGFATPPPQSAASAPTPDAALQKLDPRARATVKMVGEYREKLSDVMARANSSVRENINAAVNAVYPNYDEKKYDERHKMQLDYTSGPTGRQINAANTALGHLSVLADAADALKNNNVQLVNQIANKIGVAIGKDPVTTYKTIVHRVGPELAAAYIQGGGGEGERGTTAADFGENLGPDQLKGNLAITAKLLGSKISSNENQWKQTMDRDDFRDRFLSPEAKAALARLSPGTKTSSKSSGAFDWSKFSEHK